MSDKIIDQDTGLVLVHYKEPLLKVSSGFGYRGAILTTLDGEFIQCHVCGKLFRGLNFHIKAKHQMTTTEYKEKYELARRTALLSESERQRCKERTLEFMKTLTKKQKENYMKKAIEASRKFLKERGGSYFKIRLETKNKRGTCPDQLIQKIKDVAKEIGHTPTKNEFIDACGSQRFVHLIYSTYGSWTKALEISQLEKRVVPTVLGKKRPVYLDEELLEFLQIYHQETGKIPTETDCRRGLIPASDIYKRRWGSLPNARKKAGLPDVETSRKGKKYITS